MFEVIAKELSLSPRGVSAVLALLEEGATVPFIARYRKEATGELDEVQIRNIAERKEYLVDLEKRRESILGTIREAGKLTPELEKKLLDARTKAELEDLYLPYKTKRRTRAQIAREKGLEPLAELILTQPKQRGTHTEEELAGARDIIAERVSEKAEVRAVLRDLFLREGLVVSGKKKDEPSKFENYYDHREPAKDIPSHRFLAIRRGEEEGFLKVKIDVDEERALLKTASAFAVKPSGPYAKELGLAVRDAYDRLLEPSVSGEIFSTLKERADIAAIEIFASNLRDLLLASPLGAARVIGIDPGLRTGSKCVALDATGKFLENVTLYLTGDIEKSKHVLTLFVKKHQPRAIAIGNGTGGRETESFVRATLADQKEIVIVAVNESGASVYSASDVAREEHPDLDITVRGAISIARRLQDPLAELVKIEPKAIGVGQYQHDVEQSLLAKKLEDVVETCVNHVGVELNTASAPLLSHVAGIGPSLAKKIVKHREKKGAFRGRSGLLEVAGLGPRAFEQAAGFLRVRDGEHPLDASAVHPERYPLVERIAKELGVRLESLVGDTALADRIEISRYVGQDVGPSTLKDIVSELKKPGRDPRATFEPPKFREDVNTIEDLSVGMELEGVVTNVTAFGAFVDVGVHQDGLVHVSQLADRFVKDPREVVQAGARIKVRVLDVDIARRRIALSAKSNSSNNPAKR